MNVVIIGHGGHSKVVSDIILANKEYKIKGYLDKKYETPQTNNNLIYAPIESALKLLKDGNVKFVIAIGDNRVRKSIVEELRLSRRDYLTIIHPSAYVSPSVKIGAGTVVMPNAVINADAIIGGHCIINSCSVVEHDSFIGDFVHLCPNSTTAGTVKIGEGSCVGSGATIIPNRKIGEWAMIGAGATVIDHIPANCLAVGTPARLKEIGKLNVG